MMKYLLMIIVCFLIFSSKVQCKSMGAKAIAILPFENDAGHSLQWLSSGLSDSLIAKFSQVQDIDILEREYLETILEGRDPSDQDNLEKLVGADIILLGSYTVMDEQVRIHARLLSVRESTIKGSGIVQVTGPLAELFQLQFELARKVSNACQLNSSLHTLSKNQGANLSSYEIFNRGKLAHSAGEYNKAIEFFKKAQRVNVIYFSEAHSWEGKSRIMLSKLQTSEEEKVKVQMEHVRKFEQDASESAMAFYDLGYALQANHKYDKAIKAYDDYLQWLGDQNKTVVWKKKIKESYRYNASDAHQSQEGDSVMNPTHRKNRIAMFSGNCFFVKNFVTTQAPSCP